MKFALIFMDSLWIFTERHWHGHWYML